MLASGGADTRIRPNAALAAKTATAIAAASALRVRTASAIAAESRPSRKVMPHTPTSEALCANTGMPASAVAGVATEPPAELNDSRKSKAAHNAAKASTPASGATLRWTKRPPSTASAKKNDGPPRERTSTGRGRIPP